MKFLRLLISMFLCIIFLIFLAACANRRGGAIPDRIVFKATAQADSQQLLEISGNTNLPDGFVLLVIITPDNHRGIEIERAGLARVEIGRFRFNSGIDMPLLYKIEIVFSDKENPGFAAFFSRISPKAVPAGAIVRKNPYGGNEIVYTIHTRLGTQNEEAALIADHLRNIESMIRTAQREFDALEETALSKGSFSQWLRLHREHIDKFKLNEPFCDPLFPSLHTKARKALSSLEDGFAFNLAKREHDETQAKMLAGAKERSARFIDSAAKALTVLQDINKDLLDSK